MRERCTLIMSLFILLGAWIVQAEAELGLQNRSTSHTVIPSESDYPDEVQRPPQQNQIEEGPNGVSLQFNSIPLKQVLQTISSRTGLQFKLNSNLNELPVSSDILAPDWWTAVGLLLGELSRTEVWTGNLETSTVFIYQSTAYEDLLSSVRHVKRTLSPMQKRNQAPDKTPLPNLEGSTKATLTILPPHVLFDPGLLIYLKSVGIRLPWEYELRFESVLEGLELGHPISPATLNDPSFTDFLKYLDSIHVPLPEQVGSLK